MAILNNTHFVETQGIENQKQFGVELNSIAFKILSDKIYSDSVSAIIRELSCNAYDAHKAAGTENQPFDLKCPTEFDPHFKIRDYGTGLSEEDVYKVYSNFFVSTKRDSNDFIGALGLGSKTPFAYTDAFTVNSFFNGTKTIYSAFLGAGGVPTIAKLVEMPTEEPNGLEIVVAVKPQDFRQFKEKTEKILVLFDPKPNTNVNIQSLKFKTLEPGVFGATETWGRYNSYGKQWYAVQGNIIYPIERKHLSNADKLYKTELYFFFENGDLSFTASRESLEYDQKTIDSLNNKIQECYSIIDKKYDKIRNCQTIHEAFKAWETIDNVYGLHNFFKWNEWEFNSSGISLHNQMKTYYLANYMKSGYISNKSYRLPLNRSAESFLVVGLDKSKSNTTVIKSYLFDNPDCSYVFVLDMKDYHEVKGLGFTCMLMSELGDMYKATKKPSTTKQYPKFGLSGSYQIIEDEVYYIPTFRGKVTVRNERDVPYDKLLNKSVIEKIFEDQLIETKPIYFIPEGDLKLKALKEKKLINFLDHVEQNKDVIANHYDFIDESILDQLRWSNKYNVTHLKILIEEPICEDIKEIFEQIIDVAERSKQDTTLLDRIKGFILSFTSYSFTKNGFNLDDKYDRYFPMMRHLSYNNNQNVHKDALNYMRDQIRKHLNDFEQEW